ncbi:MAG TPA: hypothetical protein VNA20_14980 [Frankiaceae bacterium]|nr:hypothetical protein [Frankiaceae bacterium]
MRIRLALATTALALAAAPVAPAHAYACNRQMFPEVCAVHDAVCAATHATRTVCGWFG